MKLSATIQSARPHVHATSLLAHLQPGSLVLLGARPGQGKTLLGLALIAQAIEAGRNGVFFTLACSNREVLQRFEKLGKPGVGLADSFKLDNSEAINADYIIARLGTACANTVVVIDYLQLLGRKPGNPSLMDQVAALGHFASERGSTIVCLSQIADSYDPAVKPCPNMEDVRLPNPLDLSLFESACFLHKGVARIQTR